jgi:hypothetical protein
LTERAAVTDEVAAASVLDVDALSDRGQKQFYTRIVRRL